MPIVLGDDWVEKRLTPRERDEPEARRRLEAEAELLARLRGPFFPRLLARGTDAGGPWHRVERIRLPTLAERSDGGPLPRPWVEAAIRPLFTAVAALHEAADDRGPLGVVHGDPSPGNVAFDDAPSHAVLLDLDLATWRDAALPADGAFRGTLAYVAPEIARGEPPSVRSDLFAFAATLWSALLGGPPRPGTSFPALLAQAAEEPLVLVDAPAALVACLAHDPAARPASAREVLELVALPR